MKKHFIARAFALSLSLALLASCSGKSEIEPVAVNEYSGSTIISDNEEYYSKYSLSVNADAEAYYKSLLSTDDGGNREYTYQIADDDLSESKYAYTVAINSITPVKNLEDAGIDSDELFDDYYSVYSMSDELDGKREFLTLDDVIVQTDSGAQTADDCMLFLVEYEVTNVSGDLIFYEDTGIPDNGDYLDMTEIVYNMDMLNGETKMISAPIYVAEYGKTSTDYPGAIKAAKGESVKLHVGYLVKDTSFEQICFSNDNYGSLDQRTFSNVDNMYFGVAFDLSDSVQSLLNDLQG